MEHARRRVFTSDKWDCIAYMIANENEIPDNDPYLSALRDELKCNIIRTPQLYWGDLLHFISPALVSNYNYVGLLLDDIFVPHEGEKAFKPEVFLEHMKENNISVMQPAVVNDTHGRIETSRALGLDHCVAASRFVETYLQFFTPEAWECYHANLHYSGSIGWCYDACYAKQCPNFVMAHDFTMKVFHMDRQMQGLPYGDNSVVVPEGMQWTQGEPLHHGYRGLDELGICNKCGIELHDGKIFIGDDFAMDKMKCYPNRII